ncbi:RDD family protein [Paeniglutamicibacter sp. ABSL32-1]|uniref:RDD family protein n=1 Tax=Paeniglutamicibacter quisquiliarum TaxID=2849498 RepID=UPI001C2DEAC9|nr:RDD family protein [Paeniglutamicibacter quisquiliarum]MBV1778820.1 RDD family protein [Paeniglutamicibacter quisquiliarum]
MRERTRRLAATGLDYLAILAWMTILGVASLVVFLVRGELPDTLGTIGPVGSQLVYFLLLTFVVGIYLYRTEAGPHHATWGKRRMGLEVTGADGAAPSRAKILLRTIVKLLPWELAHFFVWQMMYVYYREGYESEPPPWIFVGLNAASAAALLYVVMVLATGRGPHDAAAGTTVRLRAAAAT